MKALSPEQVERILKIAADRSRRDHAMILLAYKHGLRASEICGLNMADLNMKEAKITVRRLKGSQTNEQSLYNEVGKPWMSELRVLNLWLAERKEWGQDSEYVFLSQKGGAMSRVQFYRLFDAIAKEAGIPDDLRHPHALKHGLGLAMVKQGVHLMVIKQSLGHRSLQSTAIYSAADDMMADRARRQTFANQF
jgi:type 1 fimbriae regulatory protein FimB